jgi:lysophospholipase L1-like esterase
MKVPKVVLAVAMAAAALTGAGVANAAPAPTFHHYVALGDSYTAGPLIPWQSASWCFRSNNNYPSWLATDLGLYSTSGAFTDVSCSSADTTNMTLRQTVPSTDLPITYENPQFDALTLDTDLVTIGIGGNDASVFGSLVYTCPGLRDSDPTGSPCKDHFTVNGVETLTAALATTERSLEKVVKGAHALSPGAKIVMVGYPRLVPPTGYCPDQIPFADGDYRWADSVERGLNAAIAKAAKKTGALYVDTYGPSLGHDACAGSAAWVNGQYTNLLKAVAYHPLQAGMQAEANLIYKALSGTTNTAHSAPRTAGPQTLAPAAAAALLPELKG